MGIKLNLNEYIERQKEITRNLTISESNSANRYHYRFSSDLDEEDLPGQEPAPITPDANLDAPVADPSAPPADSMGLPPTDDMGLGGADSEPPSDDMGMGDSGSELPADDMGIGSEPAIEPGVDVEGDTEIDVTELVNTTNQASQKVDTVLQKMDQTTANINTMLQNVAGMENKIKLMGDAITNLAHQVTLMRPPTEDERRKAVQQNSYPYNQSLQDSLNGNKQTQTDLEQRKNRYNVNDVTSTYNKSDIKSSF